METTELPMERFQAEEGVCRSISRASSRYPAAALGRAPLGRDAAARRSGRTRQGAGDMPVYAGRVRGGDGGVGRVGPRDGDMVASSALLPGGLPNPKGIRDWDRIILLRSGLRLAS